MFLYDMMVSENAGSFCFAYDNYCTGAVSDRFLNFMFPSRNFLWDATRLSAPISLSSSMYLPSMRVTEQVLAEAIKSAMQKEEESRFVNSYHELEAL